MSHLLLTGAGFSRNWGGWLADEAFEYLLGCPEIEEPLRHQLWQTKVKGGNFEDTLSELQEAVSRRDTPDNRYRLETLTSALIGMFDAMNRGYKSSLDVDSNDQFTLTSFLNRFAAFFTLNQDTLIEQHYKITWHKWQGWYCPGINQAPTKRTQKVDRTGPQVPEDDFELLPRMQPYIKLHGSCNWTTSREADRVLVMGGNKTGSIDRFKILRRYHEEFKRRISQPGTKLMIIGYSFSDRHINEAIYEAVAADALKMFIIDPRGVDVLDKRDPRALIRASEPNFEKLGPHIIGASRRPLSAIFGADQVEFQKIYRFLEA